MRNPRFNEAQELHREGKLEEALEIYQELLPTHKNDAELLHSLSVLHAQKRDYSRALTYIDQAIGNNTQEPAYRISKGNILLHLGQIKSAGREYFRALKIKPDYAIAYNNLGNYLYRLHKLSPAKIAYERALALDPKNIDAHFNLGILLAKLGDKDRATDLLQKVLVLRPQHPFALGQLGEIYLAHANYSKAIEYFKQRLQLQPNHAETWHSLGQACLKNDEYDEAIHAFEKTAEINPKHRDNHYDLATAYLKNGNWEEALTHYYQQLEIEPSLETYYNIGVLLINQNRYRDASQYLEAAAHIDPDYFPARINLGAIYLKLNEIPLAIAHYEKAAELQPNDMEIKHILAAITQKETPTAAPAEYLQHLFDQYALYYDQHLKKYLDYKVPEKIYQLVLEETHYKDAQWTILDLGCGTGLCGELFKSMASQLIGIDISEQMIASAKQKNIYDELKVADIHTAIGQYTQIDLVIASDVFTYIGDLESIFASIKEALAPGGWFVFSVEKTYTEPYILQPSIRYAHSKKYLTTLLNKYFTVIRFDNIVLRKQHNQPVEGYLIAAKSPT